VAAVEVLVRFWKMLMVDAFPVTILETLGALINTDLSEQNIAWFVRLVGRSRYCCRPDRYIGLAKLVARARAAFSMK
jgi:hypothetical protein